MSKNFTSSFRLFIYPHDVAEFTGRSLRNARALLHDLRMELGKKARESVSIREFCQFFNVPEDQVREYIQRTGILILFIAHLLYLVPRLSLAEKA